MKIYITGFMGSGKSTFGAELARSMGYDFADLDAEIEKLAKASISVIFEDKGEEVFRELEHKALLQTASLEDTVIATGGGTPCFKDNMDWMNQNGKTVYLKLLESELKERLLPIMNQRPLLKGIEPDGLDSFIHKTLKDRAYYYHQAQVVIAPNLVDAETFAEMLKAETI